MDTNYTLYIYNWGETDETKKVPINSMTDNAVYSIRRLVFEKGLYSPNSVDIEINVSGTPTNAEINATFASKSADLSVGGHQICKDYIVYQFRIVSASSIRTVHLTLFSRDKLLTLDKFSRVYLNQRLGLNIIEDSLKDEGILGDCKVKVLKDDKTQHLDIKRLQLLFYEKQFTVNNAPTTKQFEAIQPYRVQYNEDFYRFISRVACQCGEMLYFEDGKLTLGPDSGAGTPIKDTDISRIEYPAVADSKLTVNDYHRNFLKGKDTQLTKDNGLQYSDCEAFDEYYDILEENNLPDSTGKEFYWPDVANLVFKTTAPAFGIAFASHDAVTSAEKFVKSAKDAAVMERRYAAGSKFVNDKYVKEVFTDAEKKTAKFDSTQQKDGNQLCPFADVFSEGQLGHSRLAEIRELEMTAAKQVITVRVETSSFAGLKLKLGSRVTLPKDMDIPDMRRGNIKEELPTYIVTACRGEFFIKGKNDVKDITEIEIVPFQNIGKENKTIFVPPYNKCAEFTPVQPQTAIVSDHYDPRLVGRVRVRYPWQTESLGSPWVRVLTPFSTSKGDCIHFQPKEGDEVMLGYVGGNIERPYVIGSLFGNDKSKIHDSLFAAYDNTIKVGSQRLDFRGGSMSPFLASFVPAWGFASQFVPNVASKMKTDHSSDWHGLTRLTDANSFWKIEGNTATRAVTIDSAWGKVTISAYTGINIEAVGDVTIKGNNIKIQAQNNVTIESGLALKNARKSKNSSAGEIVAKVVTDTISDFVTLDLSFLRTLWESIVPPKEGTLKIKSNRYLMLEAGKGAAYDIDFKPNNDNGPVTVHKAFAPESDVLETSIAGIKNIFNAISKYSQVQGNTWQTMKNAQDSLEQTITAINSNIVHGRNKLKSARDVREEILNAGQFPVTVESLSDYSRLEALQNDEYKDDWQGKAEALSAAVQQYKSSIDNININIALEGDVGDYAAQVKTLINDRGVSPAARNEVYQEICEAYLKRKGFKFGEGEDWADKVKGLSAPNTVKDFLKDFASKAFGSFMTGSDYIPAYTDKGASSLLDGKIIASFEAEKSLQLTNTGSWSPSINATLASLKKELNQTFALQQPVNENNAD